MRFHKSCDSNEKSATNITHWVQSVRRCKRDLNMHHLNLILFVMWQDMSILLSLTWPFEKSISPYLSSNHLIVDTFIETSPNNIKFTNI
jgi:hypothetical protein